MDGQIYGAASAAADCFKALIPFFLFAAIRNRMWSQAARCGAGVDGRRRLLDDVGARPCRAQPARHDRSARRRGCRLQGPARQLQARPGAAGLDPGASAGGDRCRRAQRAQGPALLGRDQGMHARSPARQRATSASSSTSSTPSLPPRQQSQKLEVRIAEIGAKLAQDGGRHGHGRGRSAGERAGQDLGSRHLDRADGAHHLRGAADRDRLGLRHVRGLRLLAPARSARPSRRVQTAETAQTATAAEPPHVEPAFVPAGTAAVATAAEAGRGAARDRTAIGAPRLVPTTTAARVAYPTATCSASTEKGWLPLPKARASRRRSLYEDYCAGARSKEKDALRASQGTREIGELGVEKGADRQAHGATSASRSDPRSRRRGGQEAAEPLPRAA